MSKQTEIQWGEVPEIQEQKSKLVDSEIGLINSSWQIQPFEWFLQDNGLSYGVVQPGEDKPDGVKLIRAQNIKGGKVLFDDTKKIAPEIERQYARTRLRGDELLITVVGSLGDTVITDSSLAGCNVARAVAVARFKNIEDRAWLKYCFQYGPIQAEIGNVANTTVQPTLNLKELRQIPFPVPVPDEQRAIVEVLSSLDDKIDLLHRQNTTLEALAETLFRQWFVEEAKEQWEDGVVGDLVDFTYGKALKDQDRTGSGYPVYGSNGVVGYHSQYLVEGPGLVTGRKGTLGVINYSFTNFFPIDTAFYILSKIGSESLYFEYFLLKSLKLEDCNTDSAVPGLNRNLAHSMQISVPPIERIHAFNEHVKPYFQKTEVNQTQIQTLSTLRDTLLPKLMSGEVRVAH